MRKYSRTPKEIVDAFLVGRDPKIIAIDLEAAYHWYAPTYAKTLNEFCYVHILRVLRDEIKRLRKDLEGVRKACCLSKDKRKLGCSGKKCPGWLAARSLDGKK